MRSGLGEGAEGSCVVGGMRDWYVPYNWRGVIVE
jgi:hypothetical protein